MKALYALVEKAGWTYVQAFIAVLAVGDTLNTSTAQAAAIAALPAAITVVANGLPVTPVGLPFFVDIVLRTVRTFVASFLGLLVAVPVFELNASAAKAAAVGAIPAVLAVVKGAAATKVGASNSAATLPAQLDPQVTPEGPPAQTQAAA